MKHAPEEVTGMSELVEEYARKKAAEVAAEVAKEKDAIIDDKQDVLFHIINRTIADLEKSNNYIIRVSREDYELVNSKKQLFYDYVMDGANIEILESDNLTHNKCLIETDNSVIDCSVDTQIKNLITDLELLSKL